MFFSKILLFAASVAALPSAMTGLEARQFADTVVKNGTFGEPFGLGRDVPINLIYPAGQNGAIMVEYQHSKARELVTTVSRVPVEAFDGLFPLEPVAYRMTVSFRNGGGGNYDLLKLDYILNQDKVGKLDIRNAAFAKRNDNGGITVATDGPINFSSNSQRTMVSMDLGGKGSLDGEWAFFIPLADAIAGGLTTA
ncbi:hypothetical protein RB595_005996 [Gaeumannomyces hyphopodioides]